MLASDVIQRLGLQPLEPEGGWVKQTYLSQEKITVQGGEKRNIKTAIYYLITPDNFSRLHRLRHVEIYHFYAGAKAQLTMISPDGHWTTVLLGNDISAGQCPQCVVAPLTWQAVTVAPDEKVGWSLLGTSMAPGFDITDFEMADAREFLEKFPSEKDRILKLIRP